MTGPVVTETGLAEAVSAWYGHRAGKDVPTQKAQEVPLGEEADRRGHILERQWL